MTFTIELPAAIKVHIQFAEPARGIGAAVVGKQMLDGNLAAKDALTSTAHDEDESRVQA